MIAQTLFIPAMPLPIVRSASVYEDGKTAGMYVRLKQTHELAKITWRFDDKMGVRTLVGDKYVPCQVDQAFLVHYK